MAAVLPFCRFMQKAQPWFLTLFMQKTAQYSQILKV
jgi:hypothetical protein